MNICHLFETSEGYNCGIRITAAQQLQKAGIFLMPAQRLVDRLTARHQNLVINHVCLAAAVLRLAVNRRDVERCVLSDFAGRR